MYVGELQICGRFVITILSLSFKFLQLRTGLIDKLLFSCRLINDASLDGCLERLRGFRSITKMWGRLVIVLWFLQGIFKYLFTVGIFQLWLLSKHIAILCQVRSFFNKIYFLQLKISTFWHLMTIVAETMRELFSSLVDLLYRIFKGVATK